MRSITGVGKYSRELNIRLKEELLQQEHIYQQDDLRQDKNLHSIPFTNKQTHKQTTGN